MIGWNYGRFTVQLLMMIQSKRNTSPKSGLEESGDVRNKLEKHRGLHW